MGAENESKLNKIKSNLNINGAKKLVRKICRPIRNAKRDNRIRRNALAAQKHYKDVINNIRESGKNQIDFAAYVIFDSTYGMDGAFKKMMQDKAHWNPRVVIIPDIARGSEHAKRTYKKTRDFFIGRYGEEYVLDGWNPETNEYFDYLDRFDIVYYANPYDAMAYEYHKIEYSTTKNVLPVYVSYGYDVGHFTTLSRLKNPELNLVWKCFADTTYTYEDYCKYQTLKGKNVVLAGYSKMDNLAKSSAREKGRKKILVTPHHTVSMSELPLSNFLKYSNLYLHLPDLFPEADFVFRPHPLLFTTLINEKRWTEDDVNKYIEDLKNKGVEYSVDGDYLNVFLECDAIVNDCGSFTVEWLYTGKPGCFVYNEKLMKKHLTTLMNKAISRYTIAHNEQDIIDFISNVIEKDGFTEYKMEKWVEDNIAINYPNVSDFLISELDILK